MYSYSVALYLAGTDCPVATTVRVSRPLRNADLLLGEVCRGLGVPVGRVRNIELLAPTSPGAILLGYDSVCSTGVTPPVLFLQAPLRV